MRRIGSPLMPWQCGATRLIESTTNCRWTHSDAIIICTRQNGKSEIALAVILRRLFVAGETILFTAQRWKTARELFDRLVGFIRSRPSLRKRLAKAPTSSQGEGIIRLKSGASATFTTRSPDASRGQTKLDTLIYDEAYNLSEAEMAAASFAQDAAPDPQTIYLSSAVNAYTMPKGVVLSALRKAALEGTDPAFLLIEWMAPEDMDRLAEATWRCGNPSYGIIKTRGKVEAQLRKMNTAAGRVAFDVDALGRGIWIEEVTVEDTEPIIPIEDWSEMLDSTPQAAGDKAVAWVVSQDSEDIAIVAASRSTRGIHLSLAPVTDFDRGEALASMTSAIKKNDPVAVVTDDRGPATTIIPGLRKLGVAPELMGLKGFVDATELFLQLSKENALTHDGDARWVEALETAQLKDVSLGRVIERYPGPSVRLIAAAFAVWALAEFEIPADVEATMKQKKFDVPAPRSVTYSQSGSDIDF